MADKRCNAAVAADAAGPHASGSPDGDGASRAAPQRGQGSVAGPLEPADADGFFTRMATLERKYEMLFKGGGDAGGASSGNNSGSAPSLGVRKLQFQLPGSQDSSATTTPGDATVQPSASQDGDSVSCASSASSSSSSARVGHSRAARLTTSEEPGSPPPAPRGHVTANVAPTVPRLGGSGVCGLGGPVSPLPTSVHRLLGGVAPSLEPAPSPLPPRPLPSGAARGGTSPRTGDHVAATLEAEAAQQRALAERLAAELAAARLAAGAAVAASTSNVVGASVHSSASANAAPYGSASALSLLPTPQRTGAAEIGRISAQPQTKEVASRAACPTDSDGEGPGVELAASIPLPLPATSASRSTCTSGSFTENTWKTPTPRSTISASAAACVESTTALYGRACSGVMEGDSSAASVRALLDDSLLEDWRTVEKLAAAESPDAEERLDVLGARASEQLAAMEDAVAGLMFGLCRPKSQLEASRAHNNVEEEGQEQQQRQEPFRESTSVHEIEPQTPRQHHQQQDVRQPASTHKQLGLPRPPHPPQPQLQQQQQQLQQQVQQQMQRMPQAQPQQHQQHGREQEQQKQLEHQQQHWLLQQQLEQLQLQQQHLLQQQFHLQQQQHMQHRQQNLQQPHQQQPVQQHDERQLQSVQKQVSASESEEATRQPSNPESQPQQAPVQQSEHAAQEKGSVSAAPVSATSASIPVVVEVAPGVGRGAATSADAGSTSQELALTSSAVSGDSVVEDRPNWEALAADAECRAQAAIASEEQARAQLRDAEAACLTLQARMEEWSRALAEAQVAMGEQLTTGMKSTSSRSSSPTGKRNSSDALAGGSGGAGGGAVNALKALAALVRSLRADNQELEQRVIDVEHRAKDAEGDLATMSRECESLRSRLRLAEAEGSLEISHSEEVGGGADQDSWQIGSPLRDRQRSKQVAGDVTHSAPRQPSTSESPPNSQRHRSCCCCGVVSSAARTHSQAAAVAVQTEEGFLGGCAEAPSDSPSLLGPNSAGFGPPREPSTSQSEVNAIEPRRRAFPAVEAEFVATVCDRPRRLSAQSAEFGTELSEFTIDDDDGRYSAVATSRSKGCAQDEYAKRTAEDAEVNLWSRANHCSRRSVDKAQSTERAQRIASARKSSASNPLAGQVFVQADQLGLASYHFEPRGVDGAGGAGTGGTSGRASGSDAGDEKIFAYVSYEAAPASWATDDEQRFPPRKPFTQTAYCCETRTFFGEVDWFPSAVQGARCWAYEMRFDEAFGRIVGGQIRAFAAPDDEQPIAAVNFGKEIFYTRWCEDSMPASTPRAEPGCSVGASTSTDAASGQEPPPPSPDRAAAALAKHAIRAEEEVAVKEEPEVLTCLVPPVQVAPAYMPWSPRSQPQQPSVTIDRSAAQSQQDSGLSNVSQPDLRPLPLPPPPPPPRDVGGQNPYGLAAAEEWSQNTCSTQLRITAVDVSPPDSCATCPSGGTAAASPNISNAGCGSPPRHADVAEQRLQHDVASGTLVTDAACGLPPDMIGSAESSRPGNIVSISMTPGDSCGSPRRSARMSDPSSQRTACRDALGAACESPPRPSRSSLPILRSGIASVGLTGDGNSNSPQRPSRSAEPLQSRGPVNIALVTDVNCGSPPPRLARVSDPPQPRSTLGCSSAVGSVCSSPPKPVRVSSTGGTGAIVVCGNGAGSSTSSRAASPTPMHATAISRNSCGGASPNPGYPPPWISCGSRGNSPTSVVSVATLAPPRPRHPSPQWLKLKQQPESLPQHLPIAVQHTSQHVQQAQPVQHQVQHVQQPKPVNVQQSRPSRSSWQGATTSVRAAPVPVVPASLSARQSGRPAIGSSVVDLHALGAQTSRAASPAVDGCCGTFDHPRSPMPSLSSPLGARSRSGSSGMRGCVCGGDRPRDSLERALEELQRAKVAAARLGI